MKCRFLTIILLFFVLSCSKEETAEQPPWSANFSIDLSVYPGTKLAGLNTYLVCPDELNSNVGTWGPTGIIVSHSYMEGVYMAFNRCCRNSTCESKRTPVKLGTPDKPGDYGSAYCPDCKSVYLLYLGSGEVSSGPATKPLWVYPAPRVYGNYLSLSYSP